MSSFYQGNQKQEMKETEPPRKKMKSGSVSSSQVNLRVPSAEDKTLTNSTFAYLVKTLLFSIFSTRPKNFPEDLVAIVVEYFVVPLPVLHEIYVCYPEYRRPLIHISFSRYVPWNLLAFFTNLCEQPSLRFSECCDEQIAILRYVASVEAVRPPRESLVMKYLQSMCLESVFEFPADFETPLGFLKSLLGRSYWDTFTAKEMSSFDTLLEAIRSRLADANKHLPIKKISFYGGGGPEFEYQ